MENLALKESVEKPGTLKTAVTSVFILSTRDMNNVDLAHQNIIDMLESNGSMLNSKLFGDADSVAEFIETESRKI